MTQSEPSDSTPSDSTPSDSKRTLRILAWRPVRKGALRGYAEVLLPNGLMIPDIPVFEKEGKVNAVLPRKAVVNSEGRHGRDPRGQLQWAPVMRWRTSELEKAFGARVGELVREQHPGDFDEVHDEHGED